MKIGSSTVLSTTVNIVVYMAVRGFDAARSRAFSPKYWCVMTFPMRSTVIYSLAYGKVLSVAPKSRRIGARKMRLITTKTIPVMVFSDTVLPRIFCAV